MPNKQEFISSIRTKYPSYAGTGDEELYGAVIKKYPQYETQITDTVEKKPAGTFEQIGQIGSNIAGGLRSFGADVRKIQTGRLEEEGGMSKGLLGRTATDLKERGGNVKEALQDYNLGKQGLAETFYQVGGQNVKGIVDVFGDTFMSGLSTLASDDAKVMLKEKAKELAETKGGEWVMGKLEQAQNDMEFLKQNDPEAYRNFQATFAYMEGLSDIVGIGEVKKGLKTGKEFLKKGIGKVDELTGSIKKIKAPGFIKKIDKTKLSPIASIKGKLKGAKEDIIGVPGTIKTKLTRDIPEAVVKKDLGFTPTERGKIEKIVGKTEGQYVLEKGLAGKGKEELATIFAKQADDNFKGITTKLKSIKDTPTKSNATTEALEDILDQLTSKKKFERAYAKDIKAVKEMLARGQYTLLEKHNIRKAFDKVNTGMYTAKGQVRSGLDADLDTKLRNAISKELQDGAKKFDIDVKEMNRELRAGIEMKDALLRRLSQEERNNFIGLQDIGVSAILTGGEPISAIALIGAKKYGEAMLPSISQKLYKLNKAKNVSSRMTRGNPITSNTKSSKLGLASDIGDNMVKPSAKKTITKPKKITSKKK